MLAAALEPRSHVRAAVIALAVLALFSIAFVEPALAQDADVLGVGTLRTTVIGVFKAIAAIAVAFLFLLLMKGNHPVSAMVVVAIGVLGIAKLDAILGVLGI